MKHMKRILALALAVMMVMGLAISVSAEDTTTYSITINNTASGHTYEAYQIFKGDLKEPTAVDPTDAATTNVLSNIVWGSGVTADGQAALQAKYEVTSAAALAEKLNADNIKEFATEVSKYLATVANSDSTVEDGKYVISGLEPGYYLVKDQNGSLAGDHDAYTRYIIEVVENSTVNPKNSIPSVDKQVHDEEADAEEGHTAGWGETADHAINESFQFKLIATLTADTDYAAYETYKVVFTDTMSAGVTFESIASVTVDGVPLGSDDYECTATAGQAGGSWTLTIEDIKDFENVNLVDGASVVVIYNAHLNENAVIGDKDENKNTVYLEYSNNPNAGGENELGKTKEDTVWVFTYEIDSVKYADEIKDTNVLPGAGFTLFTTTDGTTKDAAVQLVYDTAKQAYRPASVAEIAADATADEKIVVTEMTSDAKGKFNVIGLDVGTYIMEETLVPAGYNKCADITITITATHEETDEENAETVIKFNNADPIVNNVVNKSGVVLPETGGIGTTIFYALGGVLVLVAVVLLVTKKRMATAE